VRSILGERECRPSPALAASLGLSPNFQSRGSLDHACSHAGSRAVVNPWSTCEARQSYESAGSASTSRRRRRSSVRECGKFLLYDGFSTVALVITHGAEVVKQGLPRRRAARTAPTQFGVIHAKLRAVANRAAARLAVA
jgi:hypothetical protein